MRPALKFGRYGLDNVVEWPLKPIIIDDSGGKDAYARWREEGASLVSEAYHIEPGTGPFRAQSRSLHTPQLVVSDFHYSAMGYRRTPAKIRAAPYDYIVLQSIRTGDLNLSYGGDNLTARARSVAAVDLGRPSDHHSTETVGRYLMINRAAFGEASLEILHGTILTGARQRMLDDYMAWLVGSMPEMPLNAVARTETAVTAVVLACFNPASPICGLASEVMGDLAIARACRFIDANSTGALDGAVVAKAAGVSRATLYRLFKPHGGVMEYVWRARLERARQALADPAVVGSIGTIAADAGFESGAHFSRRFTMFYGFSPRNLRPFSRPPRNPVKFRTGLQTAGRLEVEFNSLLTTR